MVFICGPKRVGVNFCSPRVGWKIRRSFRVGRFGRVDTQERALPVQSLSHPLPACVSPKTLRNFLGWLGLQSPCSKCGFNSLG